jgi:hypothetical protein
MLGLVRCPERASLSDGSLFVTLCGVYGWMGRHVHIPFLPMDVRSVALLQHYGLCIPRSHLSNPDSWRHLQDQFWERVIALSYVTLPVIPVCRITTTHSTRVAVQAQENLPGEDPSAKYIDDDADEEKVSFPSRDAGVPSFSVTFGTGSEVPPPSQMKFGLPPIRGGNHSRKLSKSRPDVDMNPNVMIKKPLPMPTSHRKLPSVESNASQGSSKTHEYDRAGGAGRGTGDTEYDGNEGLVRPGNSKRWIIE